MADNDQSTGGDGWFPFGTNDTPGWRLDIVSLLAVIGESSMAEHSQAMTSSWLACLPRIIPAPQVLLKPARPTRLPHTQAAVVGVENGVLIQTLNYFPNILHPIEELPAFAFRVYTIKHSEKRDEELQKLENLKKEKVARQTAINTQKNEGTELRNLPKPATAPGPHPELRLRTKSATMQSLKQIVTHSERKAPPHVPTKKLSPLNILSVFSFALTIGVFIMSAVNSDGVACVALATISLASSVVGYASLWSPQLMKRNSSANVPRGDVVIRTREGAFIVVKCDENVARELYTGTEECMYYVKNTNVYRALVGLGTFLLMISVVLLGNCNFEQQAAIGASYIVLNGLYWATSLMDKKRFWDLSLYDFEDDTSEQEKLADQGNAFDDDPEKRPSYTRTMWYAIRQTREVGWVRKSGAAPETQEWDEWLRAADVEIKANNMDWRAVSAKDRVVGQTEATATSPVASATLNGILVPGAQHAPAVEVPPEPTR